MDSWYDSAAVLVDSRVLYTPSPEAANSSTPSPADNPATAQVPTHQSVHTIPPTSTPTPSPEFFPTTRVPGRNEVEPPTASSSRTSLGFVVGSVAGAAAVLVASVALVTRATRLWRGDVVVDSVNTNSVAYEHFADDETRDGLAAPPIPSYAEAIVVPGHKMFLTGDHV